MRKQRKSKGLSDKDVRESETVKRVKFTPKEIEAVRWVLALPKEKQELILAAFRGLFESGAISLNKEALAKRRSSG